MKYRTCWIIDDDPIPRLLLKTKLNREKVCEEILEFENAQKALEKLREGAAIPRLIFLDINMPILTGWDFLDAVNKEQLHRNQPFDVAIVTSSIDLNDREKSKDYKEVRFFLEKPINLEAVLKAARESE